MFDYKFRSKDFYEMNEKANRALNNVGKYKDANWIKADYYRLAFLLKVQDPYSQTGLPTI